MAVGMVVWSVVDEFLDELLSCNIRGGSLAEHEMSPLADLAQHPVHRRDGQMSRPD